MTFLERTNSWVFGRFGDRVGVFCYICFVIGFYRRFFLCLIGLLATLTMVAGCGTTHKVPSGTDSITDAGAVQDTKPASDPIVTEYPNDFRPDLIVHLYPEGQQVDRGIIEYETLDNQEIIDRKNRTARAKKRKEKVRKIQVTQGPGAANQTDTTEYYWPRDGSLNAVGDSARIVIYFPRNLEKEKAATNAPTPKGQMILICPGGGYNELMFRSEGTYAAQVLTKRGYTVGIICYRMPTGNGEIPLTDVQNAFRYCRYHAEEWGISQIGIMGMSAGGHLAAMASTRFTDEITRPDFTILFYPVVSADPGLIHRGSFRKLTGLDPERIKDASEALVKRERTGLPADGDVKGTSTAGNEKGASARSPEETIPDPTIANATEDQTPDPAQAKALQALAYYSPDRHITKDTPPALLFHSIDDGVNPENSLRYYQRLIEQGVKAELHIFPSGGHGWGFNTLETAGRDKLEPWRTTFYDALFSFLENIK